MPTTNNPMIAMGVALTIVVSIGAMTNLFMVCVALRRRERMVRYAPDDFVAKITVRRTLRNELCFFAVQLFLLVASVWAIAAVTPDSPPMAVSYFYGSAVIRVLISLLMTACTMFDLMDRGRIHAEMNMLNYRQLQDEAARLGIDVTKPEEPTGL